MTQLIALKKDYLFILFYENNNNENSAQALSKVCHYLRSVIIFHDLQYPDFGFERLVIAL